jgi:hypothetical protein
MRIQLLQCRKHAVSVTKQSILYGDILIVCSDIRTKQMNTLCGQNAKSLKVRNGDTESKQRLLMVN